LLSNDKIQEVFNLLEKGFSLRKTAGLADVSLSTVKNVSRGKRSINISGESTASAYVQAEPMRCATCGSLVTLLPCPACSLSKKSKKAARQTSPSAPVENGTESSDIDISLDLRGNQYERYKNVRRRVRQQVDAGLRNPDSALSGDFVPKNNN
jgi:hypothetical protein